MSIIDCNSLSLLDSYYVVLYFTLYAFIVKCFQRLYTHRYITASYFNVTCLHSAAPSGCCVPIACNIMHLKDLPLCAAVYNVAVSAYILSYIPIHTFMSMTVCVCVYIFIYPICNILNLISFVYVMCHKVSKVESPYQQGTHSVLLYVLYLPTPKSQTYHLCWILS